MKGIPGRIVRLLMSPATRPPARTEACVRPSATTTTRARVHQVHALSQKQIKAYFGQDI